MIRISFINPNLLKDITPKQRELWNDGNFVGLPVVHLVRKATAKELEERAEIIKELKITPVPLEDSSFIAVVWKD